MLRRSKQHFSADCTNVNAFLRTAQSHRGDARMKAFSCDEYVLPLPAGHRFPMRKYHLTRDLAVARVPDLELIRPQAATRDELQLAHAENYVDRVFTGRLTPGEQREIGFPWSPRMVERSRRSVGATLGAARVAQDEGVAVNLAGGTHHAYADRGSGFCVFNDVAVSIRALRRDCLAAGREPLAIAVIDLDVHQGNGTASIVAGDDDVFTLSLHGEKNFPFRKEASDLDVGLPDGCDDDGYLAALDTALETMLGRFSPDFIFYLAGADPHVDDRLGRLDVTAAGLAARDRRVLDLATECEAPIAIAMAGGYGRDIEITCAIHAETIALAAERHRSGAFRRKVATTISAHGSAA
jgi:acetoin utilization deacetylase AcuC-like enzyme